jgi:hypothetical protein
MVPLPGGAAPADAAAVPTPVPSGKDAGPPPPSPDTRPPAEPDVDGGGEAGASSCFDQPIPLQMVPPEAIIAFDRSSTMIDARVEAVRTQLTAAMTAVDKAVQFGYLEFPERTCDLAMNVCCSATDIMLAPGRGNGMAINKLLACNANGRTCGSIGPRRTPTGDALRRISDYFKQNTPPGSPDQFAIVITDGEPNCGGQDGVCREARAAAEHLFWSDGVKTAILGIGIDASPSFNICLSEVAQDGGNLLRGSNNGQGPSYPWALETDAARLKQAVDQLLAPIKTRACVVKLAGPRTNDSDVTVSIKGTQVKFDKMHLDGWDFETKSKIRIWGSKCDEIQAGRTDPKEVEAVVMCTVCGGKLDCK